MQYNDHFFLRELL